MEYQTLVRDFARRTQINLETFRTLQKTRPDLELYEVTQLINSMLGLLVFPQQRYIDRIPEKSLDQLKCEGWPIPTVEGDYPQVENLKGLVRYLRNAIAHCNIEFLSDPSGQICGLRVWNSEPGPRRRTTWEAKLTVDDIEKITDRFVHLLLEE